MLAGAAGVLTAFAVAYPALADEWGQPAAMPDVEARLQLAETTMLALVDDAQMPPKIGT